MEEWRVQSEQPPPTPILHFSFAILSTSLICWTPLPPYGNPGYPPEHSHEYIQMYSIGLIFYTFRGQIFEWGTGRNVYYHYGLRPASLDCSIVWEREPAGVSSCGPDILETFTTNYRYYAYCIFLFILNYIICMLKSYV